MKKTESSTILGSIGEINDIQQEIESYTKKIEHEKINLRLIKERHQKQLNIYNELQSKRKPKVKWEKPKLNAFQAKKVYIEGHDKKEFAFNRDLGIFTNELELITDEVNHVLLENKELRRVIEELRKDKHNCRNQLEMHKGSKVQLENLLRDVSDDNDFNQRDKSGVIFQKKIELEMVKRDGHEEQKSFEEERQVLESRYQELIEDNIKRERDDKKEISKKKYKLAEIRPKKKKNEMESSAMEEEDISDRTPILDQLIEKWKYIIKTKKAMLERYRRNVYVTETSFERICNILGITDYRDIPFILEKIEDQSGSIKLLINNLFNEVLNLENEKRNNENTIQNLRKNNSKNTFKKNQFNQTTTSKIANLKNQISALNQDIEKKREFFLKIQEPTDNYLGSLSTSYLSEFVDGRVGVNTEVDYNETNITDVIANVQDYQKLLEDGERALQQNTERRVEQPTNNREMERLQMDNRNKLEFIKKENLMNKEMSNSIKNDMKNNTNFDDTIKRMAEEVMKMVNIQKKEESTRKKK